MAQQPAHPVGHEPYEALGELYDAWCAEVVDDVPFYVALADALALELDAAHLDVLELGCGSGRVTVPLLARGHRVRAVDASASQLTRLLERARDAGAAAHLDVAHADLVEHVAGLEHGSVDLVLIPFRTMLHATHRRAEVLGAVRDVLRPRGVLAFDAFHPSAEQVGATHGRWLHRRSARQLDGAWSFDERARYLPEHAAEPGGLKLELDVRCRWRRARRTTRDPARSDVTACIELQLVPAERWRASIEQAGLSIDGAYADFDARPLRDDDDDSVWVARRAESG